MNSLNTISDSINENRLCEIKHDTMEQLYYRVCEHANLKIIGEVFQTCRDNADSTWANWDAVDHFMTTLLDET